MGWLPILCQLPLDVEHLCKWKCRGRRSDETAVPNLTSIQRQIVHWVVKSFKVF
ncbi:hypothetical protein HOLleu_38505 [Holothuria leucospilota]|uniref:Uncharacterized protein n=1 Tax=Holothuria leucospilota TaxID=206669 RepID=A0A9Q0YEG1_HOLLE|nr:hypothetical protein HOLleu_38505 [Holothuria leucospilota]